MDTVMMWQVSDRAAFNQSFNVASQYRLQLGC